jgi:hypothetical protein
MRLERRGSRVGAEAGAGAGNGGSGAGTEDTGSEAGGGGFGAGDEGLRPLGGLSMSGGHPKQAFKAVIVVVVHLLGARLPT